MTNDKLKEMMGEIFEQAYRLGKNDGLEGVHFCPKEQYNQFLERIEISFILEKNSL